MFRQHYWDDNRFVKTQAYLSHVKEMRNQEILTAHVGHPDYPAILNFLMQASSLQLEQTRLLSQVIELLPMKGTWFFDGGNITKVQQLPYHSFNVANYFDLGWIAPGLQPFMLYYKNTDEALLYKTLGFAYVTSGYGITKGSSKQDMLTSFGYASDVFREYYTNDRYNSIRGGSGLTGYTDPASNAIREHYRLKEQAYNAAVESAEHYVEGARIYKGLLFDGQNIYIAKHPGATCANYFDLSRVDPDARKREIRFFPGHEKLLYETLGFAFLVSTSVKTPGARREDIIAKYGVKPFKHHYSQQVWRSYEVSYPTQREIEYQKYSEALAIADMQRHMKHVKKRKQIKSIVTLAPAALVGSLIPGVGGVFVSGVIKGAAFSATHAALNGGNIEKAAFQGAVFAGVGGFAGKGPIGIVATSLVDSGLNGGNPLKKIGTTLAVNHIVDLAGLPEGLTKEFVKAGASSLISGSDIGTALMAGAIGAAGSLSQQVGEELGNGIKETIQENVEQAELKKKVEKIQEQEKLVYGKTLTPSWDKVNQQWWEDENKVKAYSKKLNAEFEKGKPPTKEENPSWWAMAKRAFNGDTSPDVIEWKQNLLNQKHMQYIKAIWEGVNKGTEIGKPIQEAGLMILGGGIGTVGVNATVKTGGKMLFSYKAYRQAEKRADNIMKNGAKDRIQHEAHKTQLRQNTQKPTAENKELFEFFDRQYRPGAEVGSGSTADAFRYTAHTGKLVKGSDHVKKAHESITFLERWIENNPTASSNDRAIAENTLLDLKDAIGEKAWYSQTKPPKY